MQIYTLKYAVNEKTYTYQLDTQDQCMTFG